MRREYERRQWTTDCSTGKRGWISRAGAKVAARDMTKHGAHGLNVYRCDLCDYWHIGHVPQSVRNGRLDKAEWRAWS